MAKLDSLNSFFYERMVAVAGEIFQAVKETFSEYQLELQRSKRENLYLRNMLAEVSINTASGKPQFHLHPDCSSVFQVKLELSALQQNPEPQQPPPPHPFMVKSLNAEEKRGEHEALQINSFISISLMPCDSQLVFNNSSVVLNPSLGSPHVEGVKVKDTHSCPYCNTAFDDLSQLASHLECHKYTDPYLCQICGKRFTRRVNWKKHMIVHQGLRPFQCKFCGKGFNQKCHLTEHERVHTGEKPFSCSVCGQRFTQFNHVRKHVRIIHRDKLQTMERPNTEGFFLNTDFF
uniref:C2H2-type domain-containing protein n=1 Tax=Astyanax mexicanus TaxID=7994 RepID=A0A8B9R6Y1_ASTMX